VVQALGNFALHDARRTLITAMSSSATSLPDTQFVVGCTNGGTAVKREICQDPGCQGVRGRNKTSY